MENIECENNLGEKILENEFLICNELKGLNSAVCVSKLEYIPIEVFRKSFLEIAEAAKRKSWTSFVFDKRKLTTFHQPSMEWYYTEWKLMLVEQGLSKHYKILPSIKWFERSVEAGKHEIKEKNPDFDFSLFSVNYVNDLSDAIDQIKSV